MEENGVGTQRYKASALKKDLDNDIIELEALRVYNIMKKNRRCRWTKIFS